MTYRRDKFQIVTPSWVIPGTYAENLRFLRDKDGIDGVELLFFMYDEGVKAELDADWEEILALKERFTYTAHLPDELRPDHEELVGRLAPHVRQFVAHPPRELSPEALDRTARLLQDWTARYKKPVALEFTRSAHFSAMLPLLPEDFPLCMDTGHLLLERMPPSAFFAEHRSRVIEIHLHSVAVEAARGDSHPQSYGRLADHRRLRGDEAWFLELKPLLEAWSGVINLEVFSYAEVNTEALAALIR
jgi:sugar phosphate isomerase/epimerase